MYVLAAETTRKVIIVRNVQLASSDPRYVCVCVCVCVCVWEISFFGSTSCIIYVHRKGLSECTLKN